MEPQSHQQQNQHHPNGNCGGSGRANCPCRQTCPRWTPTSEQIRILKELYYNNGVRSPTADQIQKISARLREFGKIEGKNVFYWFQNYKARERLKKKIEGTTSTDVPMQRGGGTGWKPEDYDSKSQFQSQQMTSAGVSAQSQSVIVYTVGQKADYGYGSVSMEKSFRDCSISSSGGSSRTQNIRWVGLDPHPSSYLYFGNTKPVDEEEEQENSPEIETLPLFPMHGEDNINATYGYSKPSNSNYYSGGWYGFDDGSSSTSSASLELSLNSYNGSSSGSM